MKTWTRSEIEKLIQTNNIMVEKSLVKLYERQTSDEQACGETKHNNNVGFSGWTAKGGTFYAKCVINSQKPCGQRLWGKGLEKARKICMHHAGQLTLVANQLSSKKEVKV